MKPAKNALDRLLRAGARAAQPEVPGELPFALETRVLAQWRGARHGLVLPDDFELTAAILSLFRRGLAWACLLMVASLAFGVLRGGRSVQPVWNDPSSLVSLANSQ